MPLINPRHHWLVAWLAGASGILAFAPFGFFWFAPVPWLLLFAVLRCAASTKQAAWLGFWFGSGFFLAGVSWIYISLATFGGMPWWLAGPATLIFCLFLALYPALASGLFKRWQPEAFWRQALLFAALIATVDALRGWIFTGFPWLALGYSQAPPSPLTGFAPLIGVYGLSLLTALAAASLLRWRAGLLLIALLSLVGHGLRQHSWTDAQGEPIRVALVQGNVPQEMKFQPDAFIRTLSLYYDLVAANPAQLTLLPETALPAFIDQIPPEYLADLKTLAKRQQGDLIFGSVTGQLPDRYFNSAISLGHSGMQIYSKHHLVPFGEFIPAGFAWLMAQASIPMSSFSAGPASQAPLQVAGQQVAVNICYEDVFGREIIRQLPEAGILANISNTAWFGRSLAQPQHLQIAQLRAAETGRPMLRATNTGMTAIIDARGNVTSALPPFTTGVLTGEVQAYQGSTPYIRFGDWPVLGLLLLSLALALRPGVTGRRQR